eukprot:TRINITY_DN777866_c0_g1_i1.p1 TRINITY_DN777866_c0_g1~~TRINITY_DN777866_c0_g1_i1.p1  ORF type:complete len:576 (-),score=123.45 TRINITY_DN777866_c0_g1_i1:130-1824(-)
MGSAASTISIEECLTDIEVKARKKSFSGEIDLSDYELKTKDLNRLIGIVNDAKNVDILKLGTLTEEHSEKLARELDWDSSLSEIHFNGVTLSVGFILSDSEIDLSILDIGLAHITFLAYLLMNQDCEAETLILEEYEIPISAYRRVTKAISIPSALLFKLEPVEVVMISELVRYNKSIEKIQLDSAIMIHDPALVKDKEVVINCSNCVSGNDFIFILSMLRRRKDIEKLRIQCLSFSTFSAWFCDLLFDVLQHNANALTDIEFNRLGCIADNTSAEQLADLFSQMPKLKHMSLVGCSLASDLLEPLLGRLPAIQTLDLSHNRFGDFMVGKHGFGRSNLARRNSLSTCEESAQSMTSTIRTIENIGQMRNLRELRCANTGLNVWKLKQIFHCLSTGCPDLQVLDLSHNSINMSGGMAMAEGIQELSEKPRSRLSLNLSGIHCEEAVSKILSSSLTSTLGHVCLDYNVVCHTDFESFMGALKNLPCMTTISLKRCIPPSLSRHLTDSDTTDQIIEKTEIYAQWFFDKLRHDAPVQLPTKTIQEFGDLLHMAGFKLFSCSESSLPNG